MTAAELHALVQHWPEEARPRRCAYLAFCDYGQTIGFHDTGGNDIDPDHAIALHVASGLEWLNITHHNVLIQHGVEWEVVATVFKSERQHIGTGPTLLHAISAAITATKESP